VRIDPRQWSAAALLMMLVALGCGGPGSPTDPTSFSPPVSPTPSQPPSSAVNNPPRILSIITSASRVELGEEITLTADVKDDESADNEMTYRWEAPSGSITGTGLVVKWKAPTVALTPVTYKITLMVIEKYGPGQTLEHRVTEQSPEIRVHDSPWEIRTLSEQFLRDFADSSKVPEYCVRNFLDSCPGKQKELKDIINNRLVYTIMSSRISSSPKITFNTTRTTSQYLAGCTFTSRIKATGAIEVADGTCDLDFKYENDQWWLCESSYHGLNAAGLRFIF
jgi:hypothetical protein